MGERGKTAMTQQIRPVKFADDCAAKSPNGSPTVVFLPFSEDLLSGNKRHTPCWEGAAISPKSTLVTANYPSFGGPANLGERSTHLDSAGSGTAMTLVPYTQQAMTVHVLRGERWEAL